MTLGPGQAVEMPGAADDPSEALRGADLFVLPSREEGMSIALLEAMALGIPLVASSIPGNRRLVSDFKHGRLAPPDDPEGLARVIIDQWDNFDRAFHMSRAARTASIRNSRFKLSRANTWHCSKTFWRIGSRHLDESDFCIPTAYMPTTRDRTCSKSCN